MPTKDYLGKDQRRTKDDKPVEEKPIKGKKCCCFFNLTFSHQSYFFFST